MKVFAGTRLIAAATAKDLKATLPLLEKKVAYYTKAVHELESQKTNPTARDVYHNHVGKRDALEAVLQALNGKVRELDQL